MDTADQILVVLQPYGNRAFNLPRDWIHTALSTSILSSFLKEDPNATTILIPNSDVTPNAMQVLVDLSQGREPSHHLPELVLADRYLNIPQLLYYADPLYDQIPDRNNGNAPENESIISKSLQEDRIWPFSYLLFKGYVPTNDDFKIASSYGATNIVRLLLTDPRINPGELHKGLIGSAIRWAAEHGHLDVVRLLLADPRVDPTAVENDPIYFAAKNGHLEVARLLLADPRVDPADLDNRTIKIAAANNHPDIVQLLLADPRVELKAGDNVLGEAAKAGSLEVVKLLLADPEGRVNIAQEGNKAIRLAAAGGHLEVVRLLLADPRIASVEGALSDAIYRNYPEIVKLLLADPRVNPAEYDNLPIEFATRHGQLEVVRLLLADPRVDPTARNNIAIENALLRGDVEIVNLINNRPKPRSKMGWLSWIFGDT